ncbi:MAG: hypothetical protein ABWZ63_08105, partial [Thermoleophilaceae bacterium]
PSLFLAFADSKYSAVAGKPAVLKYVATAAGTVKLTVTKGRKTYGTISARVKPGRNTIKLPAKLKASASAKAIALTRGSYTLKLVLTDTAGRTATDAAKLAVTAARKKR